MVEETSPVQSAEWIRRRDHQPHRGEQGGSIFVPYCHTPSYVASKQTDLVAGLMVDALDQAADSGSREAALVHFVERVGVDEVGSEGPTGVRLSSCFC